MANFLPFKHYQFLQIDHLIRNLALKGPFLEIGCGTGDASLHLAKRGWSGIAMDISHEATEVSKRKLANYPQVLVMQGGLESVQGTFQTIVMIDVLEHIQDDVQALRQVERLLEPSGCAILITPSNDREWRWDDDFYGHVRHYTKESYEEKIKDTGLSLRVAWDVSYPMYWAMRRMYTRLKAAPSNQEQNIARRTMISSYTSAWEIPIVSSLLQWTSWLWWPINQLQFLFFRNSLERGCEMVVALQKNRTVTR